MSVAALGPRDAKELFEVTARQQVAVEIFQLAGGVWMARRRLPMDRSGLPRTRGDRPLVLWRGLRF